MNHSQKRNLAISATLRKLAKPLAERFNEKWVPEPFSGCWLWMSAVERPGGYGKIKRGQGGPMVAAHRIAWELFNGPVPLGKFVLHNCDTKMCVNPGHLRLGTQVDNMRDARERGQMVVGERVHCAKLREEDVRAIRALSPHYSQRELAKRFRVTQGVIMKIQQGRIWKTVV